jgi:cell division septal protein FtsQ
VQTGRNEKEPTMTRRISATIRLVGVTLALAAGIVGFSATATATATASAPAAPALVVATSFSPAGH